MTLAAHRYCVTQQNSVSVSIYFYCFDARLSHLIVFEFFSTEG